MYQVSAQGVDENMLNVHYYYVLGKVLFSWPFGQHAASILRSSLSFLS